MNERELIENNGEQPVGRISDEELEFLIKREFPAYVDIVKSKLNNIKSDTQLGRNRIAASVLKIANKELNEIDTIVIRANNDCRDIICEAEYPKASSFEFGERSEEENKKDYLEDWGKYSAWINKDK